MSSDASDTPPEEDKEKVILRNIIHNESYLRKVFPFLRADYFQDTERRVFSLISDFIGKYNVPPTPEALHIALDEDTRLSEQQERDAKKYIDSVLRQPPTDNTDAKWLLDITEKFCQDQAIYNALVESIAIADGQDKKKTPHAIPKILTDALAVSFDPHIGHSFFDDVDQRYEFYHRKETKIRFRLDMFNRVTNGGMSEKTLNVVLGGTGVGKTMFMCDFAAGALMDGKNVLYITLEMSEEEIARRIDANLIDIPVEDIGNLPVDRFKRTIETLRRKTIGSLIIKEYPTSTAHAGHFRNLMNELLLKREFKPDVLIVDYINICASDRIRMGGTVGSYTYVKFIAEELRGLAVEMGIPVFTGTQLNRVGFKSDNPDLDDVAESWGLPHTTDWMFVILQNEDLERAGQMMVIQLKNRYNNLFSNKRFLIGVDRTRMKFFDVASNDDSSEPEFDADNNNNVLNKKDNKFTGFRV